MCIDACKMPKCQRLASGISNADPLAITSGPKKPSGMKRRASEDTFGTNKYRERGCRISPNR